MNIPQFKYFENPLKNAAFVDINCQICGTSEHCLDGEYFDYGDDMESICIECLANGRQTTNIPDFTRKKLIDLLKQENPNMDEQHISYIANERINELSKTPPVQWIQYNNWPVCCGDFTRFIGEWSQQDFIDNSSNGNGIEYVYSILDDLTKSKIDDINVFWNDIGKYTALFVFECIECKKRIAVAQSY